MLDIPPPADAQIVGPIWGWTGSRYYRVDSTDDNPDGMLKRGNAYWVFSLADELRINVSR
jgi:hypothetical protein